jgi:hypothetical protein
MPVGLTGLYRADEENYPGQVNPASLQLPTRQVDPYMRTLLKLQDSGLLTPKFVQGQIGNPLLRQDFLDSGVVGPRQPFGPGQAGLTQEELQKLGGLRRNVALRQGDKTTFIPREHTEPSGWIKLLEVFGAFNFAVAGASNALVNLYQGKTEETNPFVEAYRGFTLKDKEIFGDVLENLGWEGEDGFAYWSRESLGFVMDVVLDPINFISLGSPQAAKLARGIATKVPLRGKAVMGATTIKPMDELGKISSKIVEEGLEKLQRGEAFILGSSETQRRARALEDAVKRSLDPTVSVDEIAEGMGSLEVGLARMSLEDGVNQEVQAVLSMLARHNDPRTLRKLLEESGGGSQELRRWLSALGGDPTGEITGDILRHFLRMEGEDLTEEAITKFLTTSGGIKKLIDPGGLQLRIPFTDKGFVIAEAQWLDGFALSVESGIVKALGVAVTFTPQPIRKAVSYAAEGIAASARKGAHSISRAFGVNGRRSGILNSLLKNRDTNLKNSQSKSEERAQEILTWKIDGKESALPEDLHEVLVDTILAEQDLAYKHIEEGHRFFSEATARKRIEVLRETNTPESLAEAARIEGSNTPLGYTQTVIPKIGDDPRLVGRSGEEITELERIARSVHEVFAEQYDAAVDAGVHVQFMDYYLPVQYSNWSSVKNVQLSTGNEIARVAGEDVFARARTITKEEADRLGLKVDKNLYSLVYNRLFQGKRTQIERMFVAKLIEQVAVHPGQIGEVLRKLYGPGSRESQEMLDILLKQSDYTELLNEDNLQVLIPGLDQFRNYIQTGRLDDAARWIEVNEDLVPLLASGSGRTGFFEAVQNDLQQTLGTLKDWTDSLMTTERGFLAAEEKLFTALESSLADLDWLRIEGEALSIPDLDPAAAVGAAVRSILKERIAVLLPDVDLGSLSPIELLKRIPGESSWINLPATAGQDSGKLAILMNALDDSTEAGDKIKNKLLQKAPQLEQTLQEIAEDLVETILDSRRLTDNSVVTARMEEQLLEMALSSLPGAALERVAGRSVIITRGVNEAAVSNKLQELLELELAEKFDEMADLTDELVTQYARHPEIHEWYNNWRKSHDLPPDPSIPNLSDRVELKSRIISSMREAKEHAHRSGMSMFRLPVYAAGPQLPAGRAQRSAIEKMKQTIRRELGDDGHRFQEMLNEMMQPSVSMPGYHYSPLRATRNSVLNLYANEGSSVLNLIVDISKKLDPHEVVREVFAEKLKWGGLVRSLVGQPERLKGILEKLSQSTTNRLTSAISQIPGAQLDEAQSLIVKLEADLTDLLGSRWETGTTLTDVHLQVEATFAQFSEGLERILPTEEGRLLMFAGIDEMKTALIDSNQKTIRLYQRARELSQTITELSQNPAAILGEATETVLKSVDELVALRDEIQAALNSADEATSQLLQPNNPLPDGWAQILPEQEISNALLGEAKVLYNDMAGVFGESQELLDAFRTSQLEIAKNKRAAAAAALAGIDRDLIPVESAVNDVIMQVEYVRQATGVQKRALARLGDIQTALDAGGDLYSRNQQDMLRSFLEVSIVDEFLKGGDLTPAGWAAAGERVGTQGPKKTQILKHWWKQIGDMDDVATREVFMMTQEIVTQQAPKVGDAKLYAAIHRTAFIEGPVADDIIGAAQAAFDSVDPTILEDLGVVAPEILIRAEAAARSAVGSRRSTEGLIARLAEGAFLPDGELREIAESMHYERKFIVHLVREMSAKQGVIEGLFGARSPVGRKLMQDLRGGLQNTLIQQRQVVLDPTSATMLGEEVERLSSELVLLVATDKQKALTRLGEIVGPGADAQELIALLDTAAVELSQLPRAEQFQAMISRIRENIEGLYAPVVDLLDDTASARVLNQGGVPQVISDWMRQNDQISLEPQEIAVLEELMEDLNGPTGSTPQPLLVQLQNALEAPGTSRYPLESRERWHANADYEARNASLVEMTPDEFLSRTKPLTIDEVTLENIAELKGKMERGEPLDPLTIYRDDLTDVRASDGRHRAIAAKELGMDSVPVLDFTSTPRPVEGPTFSERKRSSSTLLSDGMSDQARTQIQKSIDEDIGPTLSGEYEVLADGVVVGRVERIGTGKWHTFGPDLDDIEPASDVSFRTKASAIESIKGWNVESFLPSTPAAAQTPSPLAPELQKRAQYWLYRLGQGYGGEAVGNAGLTTNQLDGLAKGLGRYKDRTQGADATAVAKRELLGTPGGDPGTLQATREAAASKYEARAVLKSEVDMLDQVIPHMEQGTYIEDALEYTPEQAGTWRGMYAIQNYLKLQVRRSEHLALTQTLNELPSRAELNYLLMRSQMEVVDDPQALADLNKLRLAGVGQGRGVMSPEQTAKLDELTATRRVAIEEAGAFVSAHGGKKVRDLLGLDFENLPIQYGTDVPVSQQFLFHVDEFARQLPDDMSNMAGSEGAKIVQEVDGRLVVAETVEAAGVKTDANRDLVNSVAQVHDYLKLVEETGGNLSRVPALELQKRQLNFALRRFFPDEAGSASLEKRKLLLQAVVGHQNINRLDAAEASTVLRFLQTNLDPMVNEFGEKSLAAIQSAELQLLGLKSRGLLPKKLEEKYRRGLLTDDELLVEFSKLPSIEGGVEHPVMLRFPGMLDQTDPRYGQVDLTWGMGSTKEKRGLGQSVIVPKWMQNAIEDSVSPEREIGPVARGMFRVVDTFTNTFKWAMTLPWPAFHFRNVLDATARTFLALGVKGLSPTWNRNVLEIMRSNPAAKMTIRGVEYDAKTLLNMFEDLGGQVDFAQKIGQTALKMDVGDPRVLSPLSDNFVMKGANALADTAATIAGKGDNFFRLSIWLDSMEKGMGATGAMHYAQKFLFDYAHGLTPFERNFMRRLVPFYTFSRFNVPLQLELMFKQPGLISAMGKTQNLFSESRKDPIEDLLPSYIREQWRFGPTIEDGQLKIWSGRNLLATEELRFLGDIAAGQGVIKTTADEFFARINPMLKIPVELYVGHNMYFDTKVAEDQTIRGAVLDWPGIRDWLDMRKVKIGSGTDARVLYRVNGARYHLLNQLHFSRVYRTLVQTVGPGEQGAWQRLVPFVTGLRLTSIDLTRRLKHLESVSNFNNEKIRKALAQGDHVAAKRLAGLTERQPYQTVRLEESYEALEGIVEQTSRYP